MRLIKLFISVGFLGLITLSTAHAIPIAHVVEFTVGNIAGSADPRVQIGNSYFGFFDVDDSLLSSTAFNTAGTLSSFRIQMEDQLWDMNSPYPTSAFHGFRGPSGLGSSSPGFDVIGGAIVNLRGGVYGIGDFPYVDFSSPTANTFATNNPLGIFSGSMFVHRIPEPGSLACIAFGILALAISRRRMAASLRFARSK